MFSFISDIILSVATLIGVAASLLLLFFLITENNLKIANADRVNELVSQSENISLEELEIKYILRVLEKTKGNKLKAAEILKINRKTLAKKLKDYNL